MSSIFVQYSFKKIAVKVFSLDEFIESGTALLPVDMSHIDFSVERVQTEPKKQETHRSQLEDVYPEGSITRQFIAALETQYPEFIGRNYKISTHRSGLISGTGIAISDGSNSWNSDQENNGRPHLIYLF